MAYEPVIRLRCPTCGRPGLSFAQLGGPVREIHYVSGGSNRARKACRNVVTPDPFGDAHEWLGVPNDIRVEDVWRALRQAWDERWSRELLEKVGRCQCAVTSAD